MFTYTDESNADLPQRRGGEGVGARGARDGANQVPGRWLAYLSDESGNPEVYVAPYGRSGEAVRVSTNGGGQPQWRDDGEELFYVSFPDHELMAVEIREVADRIEVGVPTGLFPMEVVGFPQSADYGVTADGRRFLVKVLAGEPAVPRIHVSTNWPSLLE